MIVTHELSICLAECGEALPKACSPLRSIDRVYRAVPVHLTAAVLVHQFACELWKVDIFIRRYQQGV